MDSEVMFAGISFTIDDQRLYDKPSLRRLAALLIEQRAQKQLLHSDCRQQLVRYENDQLIARQFEGDDSYVFATLYLLDVERVRLIYEMSLRWLQLARWHQGDLCWHGFSQSSAHMTVGDSLVQLHTKELMLRGYADTLGIPTIRYRRIYL